MAAPLLSGALLALAVWGGAPLAGVELDAPGARDIGRLRTTFGVRPGDLLSRAEIRRAVHALIASGEVEDVAVDLAEGPSGPVLHVGIQVANRVGVVRVTGLPRRLASRVWVVLGVVEGTPLRVAAFEAGLATATAELRNEGYPEATLEPDLVFDGNAGTVAVSVEGDLGPALAAGAFEAPEAELDEGALRAATGLEPGLRLSRARLERARTRLAKALRRAGYWEAEVESPSLSGPMESSTVSFPVRRGPRWELVLSGLKPTKSLKRAALPFLLGEESFSDAMLDQTVARVRTWVQRSGHLLVIVTASLDEADGVRRLHLGVVRGPHTRIEEVRLAGVDGELGERLRAKIAARPGRPGGWGREPIDADTLAADTASLLGSLGDEGFAGARVGVPVIVAAQGGFVIEFPIEAGERVLVDSVEVAGAPAGVALPQLGLVAGRPWSRARQDEDRIAVLEAVQNAGFADAHVDSSEECVAQRCRVRFGVVPGEPVAVGRVVIAGLAATRPSVVEKVAALRSGDRLGPETVLAAQRRLLSLGLFRRVSVRVVPGQEPGPRRDIVVELQEGPTRAFGVGLGWDTEEDARVSVIWSELSLFGSGRGLDVVARVSSREQRWQVSYREPARLGLLGVPVWVAVYRTEETFDTYSLLRRGMWLDLGDRQRRPLRAILRYEYQIVDPTAPDEILSDLERDKQRAKIASLTPILEFDTRDDLFEPKRGVYASGQIQVAFPLFDADAFFNKVTLNAAGFTPLGPGVLAGSIRLGGVEPRDPEAGVSNNLSVPIAVRFFAGGRVTHRAFPLDKLGRPGETLDENGDPIGGAGLALANLEWRFPVFGAIGGALFIDSGNVWSDWRDINAGQFRWGAGLGLRVATPVGPVRLEYGWKLDRKPGESAGELFFSFSNPF